MFALVQPTLVYYTGVCIYVHTQLRKLCISPCPETLQFMYAMHIHGFTQIEQTNLLFSDSITTCRAQSIQMN